MNTLLARLVVVALSLLLQMCTAPVRADAAKTCGGAKTNVTWIYHGGTMSSYWPHDYSFGDLHVDYDDKTGAPIDGKHDIKITSKLYAGWQPASIHSSFDIAGCKYLTFALKPTHAKQRWHASFLYVGDVPTDVIVFVTSSAYGPAEPTPGEWSTYKIPLADFFPNGAVPKTIYKFFIQDMSGIADNGSQNVWYIDSVGFSAD